MFVHVYIYIYIYYIVIVYNHNIYITIYSYIHCILQVYTMAYHVDIQTHSNWYNVGFYLYDILNLLLKHSETPAAPWVEFIEFLPLEQWKQDWFPQSTSLRSMRFAGEGLCTAIEYYNLPLAAVVGTSVPAAEHSTITSWTKAGTMVDHDYAHITHHQRLSHYYLRLLF